MRVLLAVALALSLASSHQTSTAGQERTPVRVDAIAADARGRIVADLAPADFEVFDDGGARTVESVRLVRAEGSAPPGQVLQPILSAADEQVEASREGTRLFAFFLDEYHVAPGAETARTREAMGRFVDEYLGPRDLVLVVKPLDSLIALRLTRDLEAARRAIASFEGRKGELEPRTAFERNYIGASPARIEAVREQIVTSALNALATHLAGLGASRKTLVVVSEGFIPAQRRRGDESLPTLESVIRSANRAGASIYAIDPRGLVATPRSAGDVDQDTAGQDALLALSSETGGRAILGSAAPADELSRIARDASGYYLITFQSEREADGRFHPLDVRMRRPGVELRVRKGYWASLADSVWRSRLSTSAEAVRPPEPPRRTSPLIRPWFGLSRGDAGKTRVSFVWEPAARVPGDRIRTLTPVRLTLRASKPDGTLVFEGAVRPTGSVTSAGAGDEPPRAVFEAAPGRLRVQMSIEDATSRVVDTDVRDVVVGPLSGPLVLGTAEVLRAGNARAYRALADATAAPVAARVFSRTERLLIRVPVYAADQSAVLKASLGSRPGTSMRALPVTQSSRPDVYEVDLPLAGLAAGDYVVELTAKSPGGDANDVVAFRVTP